MKASVLSLQFAPQKANKKANINKVVELIKKHGRNKYDLIVLPEFFDTGFNLSNAERKNTLETEENSFVLNELSKIAKQYNSYIHCGSILFNDNDKCYNRAYFLNRNGEIIAKYDKIHLFNYFGGNEGTYSCAGEQICVVETDFAKIGLATCFDLRFPCMFNKLLRKGAEVFVLPAAWSCINKATEEYRVQFLKNWRNMTTIRAYDNCAFIVTANEAGDVHPIFTGIGNSMIADYYGRILAEGDDKEAAIYAELDFDELRAARKIFPIDVLD